MSSQRTTVDPHDEPTHGQRQVAGLSQSQIVRSRFVRRKAAMVAVAVLLLMLVLAYSSVGFGPVPGWYEWHANEVIPPVKNDQPTIGIIPSFLGGDGFAWGPHPFGVDNQLGKDLFANTMLGVQVTMLMIIVLALVSVTIGVAVGAIAGYRGGWVDSALMRITDGIITIPLLIVAAIVGTLFGTSEPLQVATLIGVFSWTGLARLVRAEVLALRQREFVDAARVAGASDRRIIFKHILPNTVGTIVVSTTLLMAVGILVEAALAFLGFGVRPPNVSLGNLVSDYDGAFSTRPWLFVFPGMMIVIIVLCLQFIGDGLRDAFDPRQNRVPKFKHLRPASENIAERHAPSNRSASTDDSQ